jgi:fatty acid desaturase
MNAPVGTIPRPKEQRIPTGENLFKTLLLIALLMASFVAADQAAKAIDASTALPGAAATVAKWTLVALLAIVNGVLLVGLAVLAHDAVHKVLFPSAFWNELAGGVLSALVLVPFYANRQYHITHHGCAHQPGLDPEEGMHRHRFWYAATLGSLHGFDAHFRIVVTNLRRMAEPRCAGRGLADIAFMASAGAIYFWLVPALGVSISVSVLPAIPGFLAAFAFRGLSDHYGVPPVRRAGDAAWEADRSQRRRDVSGWVVRTTPWLEWLWSHVNYHEVHHKFPYLSHRYLPQAFAATHDTHSYLVVRGYWRSLLNQRKRAYYASPEDVRAFLHPEGAR